MEFALPLKQICAENILHQILSGIRKDLFYYCSRSSIASFWWRAITFVSCTYPLSHVRGVHPSRWNSFRYTILSIPNYGYAWLIHHLRWSITTFRVSFQVRYEVANLLISSLVHHSFLLWLECSSESFIEVFFSLKRFLHRQNVLDLLCSSYFYLIG